MRHETAGSWWPRVRARCAARPPAPATTDAWQIRYASASLLDFSDPANQLTRFLSVDAMSLQHSEVHGRWNSHVHLARLRLVLVDGIVSRYPFTPLLSAATDSFRLRRPRPTPMAPRRPAAVAHSPRMI